MKALLVLLAVLAGVWLWRSGRQRNLASRQRPQERPTGAPGGLQQMACCVVCGVHLPQAEALVGRQGVYCSPAHRQKAEG